MVWWDESSEQYNAYQTITERPHEAEWSDQLIANAAAYEAAKAFERQRVEFGEPEDHATAQEILAGFAGDFVDREVESKGLNYIDNEKVKHLALKQAQAKYSARYRD